MSEVTARDIKLALAKKHQTEFFLTEVKNGPTGVARGQLLIFDAIAIYKSWSRPQNPQKLEDAFVRLDATIKKINEVREQAALSGTGTGGGAIWQDRKKRA